MRLRDLFLHLPLAVAGLGPLTDRDATALNATDPAPPAPISATLFSELEELARLVDIAYCVGSPGFGVRKPFRCASRCDEFPHMSLVTTWHTGPLLSDSCGYIAVDEDPSRPPRILVAFRGTYSIANTIADLSTVPQEYMPYPEDPADPTDPPVAPPDDGASLLRAATACPNCTVHSGFLGTWRHARRLVLPALLPTLAAHAERATNATLHLVGHSLGGAVACLAALELRGRGWDPVVTTFGEPMVGNAAFAGYVDAEFHSSSSSSPDDGDERYRRVTHVGDPVPLLPLEEWGYAPHAGEVFIRAPALPPARADVVACRGPSDGACSRGDAAAAGWWGGWVRNPIPPRWRVWELLFAHRDYFWRLGLCVPGGDPWSWPGYGYPREGAEEGVETGAMTDGVTSWEL